MNIITETNKKTTKNPNAGKTSRNCMCIDRYRSGSTAWLILFTQI